MNLLTAKADTSGVEKTGETRPHGSLAGELAMPPELIDEPAGNTDRRLYRRSVAYFFFGLGCNQHTIVTDEP